MSILCFLTLTLLYLCHTAIPPKQYLCNKNTQRCEQQPLDTTQGTGLGVCRMLCDPSANLWPQPTNVQFTPNVIPIQISSIKVTHSQPTEVGSLVDEATKFFLNIVSLSGGDGRVMEEGGGESAPAVVSINTVINGPDTDLTITTDESYTLRIAGNGSSIMVSIQAQTFFGMRHGLETLSQLILYDEVTKTPVILNQAQITDRPKFRYRGLILDTSRQFYSIPVLKHILDAMSFDKLNFFHLHFTDTSSFPFESLAVPELTYYGAFSDDQVYRQTDIKDLVEYGKSRGVRVLPELDAPSHVGNGWQWGPKEGKGNLAVCVNQQPWESYCYEPPCGQINPINNNSYDILKALYQEMSCVFGNPSLFHMGGDEVNIACWNATEEIVAWLKSHGRDRSTEQFDILWGQFQQLARQYLAAVTSCPNSGPLNPQAILWTSDLVNNPSLSKQYIPTDQYIIQVWDPSSNKAIPNLLQQGYQIIVSNYDAWYLDCGFGDWVSSGSNWCSPYKEWQLMYKNKPYASLDGKWTITDPKQKSLILGGEVALWSEEADSTSVESRVWPRASAVAERLWSDPQTTWQQADDRMQYHRHRLVFRGIDADALQPQWCLQNQGECTEQSQEIDTEKIVEK